VPLGLRPPQPRSEDGQHQQDDVAGRRDPGKSGNGEGGFFFKGTGALVGGAAFAVAGLAWIPAAGYVVLLSLPVLAARVRRAQPERYAGLRTLARDE